MFYRGHLSYSWYLLHWPAIGLGLLAAAGLTPAEALRAASRGPGERAGGDTIREALPGYILHHDEGAVAGFLDLDALFFKTIGKGAHNRIIMGVTHPGDDGNGFHVGLHIGKQPCLANGAHHHRPVRSDSEICQNSFEVLGLGLPAADLSVAEDLVEEVVEGLHSGEYPLAALVMPATVDHIRMISLGGERMPPKSTYFYPKLLSGLVINPLE